MIFNEDKSRDLINILAYIDEYALKLSIDQLQINIEEMKKVIEGMRFPFPHVDGIEDASAFKKVSNFLSWFLALKPIKTQLPKYIFSKELPECDINAVIAFDISLIALERSIIHQKKGNGDFVVSNPIFLSEHSYLDILEALNEDNIKPETHQKIFSVFLEQLVYKTNPECQYKSTNSSNYKYTKENLKPSYQNIFLCDNCGRENGKKDSRCFGCGKMLA